MKNKLILESLSSDLKRVFLGLQRGSKTMANRFEEEALKRKNEIDTNEISPYMRSILEKIESVLHNNDEGRKAEDALMYSTLIQNYVLYK